MQALLRQASCLVVVCINLARPKRTDLPCAFQGGTNAGLRAWGVGEIVSFGAAGKVKQVQISVHACPKQSITLLFAAANLEAQQVLLLLCMLTGSTAMMFCAPHYIYMLHQAYNQNDSIHSGLAAS